MTTSSSSIISDAGSIVIGLVLVVLAGILNGSWNVSFRPTHGYAVGRRQSTDDCCNNNGNSNDHDNNTSGKTNDDDDDDDDLEYHQAWILFQIYAIIINIPICLYWAGGPTQVGHLIQGTATTDLILVALFSLLWGVGSVGFGVACQIAGVGLGTNLCMGCIMVLGTFLPLCLDGAITTAAGALVVAGLCCCCAGLALAVGSLHIRDVDEQKAAVTTTTPPSTTTTTTTTTTRDELTTNGESKLPPETTSLTTSTIAPVAVMPLSNDSDDNTCSRHDYHADYSTTYKVAVCVIAGIFATQLQFAFVFGQDMIDLAKESDHNVPPSGTSAVVWLFAFTLGAPASIIYGIYNNPRHIPWTRLYTCPWYRHGLVLLTTSIPWVAHVHMYGYSTTLLPDDLAASVAWPILMMVTVVTGMLWSIVLGEWTHASRQAKVKLYQGLAAVSLGVIVIMSSVSL